MITRWLPLHHGQILYLQTVGYLTNKDCIFVLVIRESTVHMLSLRFYYWINVFQKTNKSN